MLKTKTKVKIGFVSVLSIAAGVQASAIVAQQVAAETTTFQVNVVESLSVSLTTDSSESTGGINTFLRSPVTLEVTSNNSAGFYASMHSSTDATKNTGANKTDLVSGTNTISTLSSNTEKSKFTDTAWGFSLQNETTSNDEAATGDNAAGKDSSTYSPMTDSTSTPTTLMSRTAAATGEQKVWFGTKATASQASGDYKNTVVFNVVSGISTNPGSDPVNPVNPDDNKPSGATDGPSGTTEGGTTYSSYYDSTNNRSVGVANTTAESGTTTEQTTDISTGNTVNSYTPPQGVREETSSSINSGAPLATGLAVTAGVAAVSGLIFFILAKRKKDDDEEEEQA